jgi:hypothetical protein
MNNHRLRSLERAWHAHGGQEVARGYVRALLRSGVSDQALESPEAAFVAGHLAAEAEPAQAGLAQLFGEASRPGPAGYWLEHRLDDRWVRFGYVMEATHQPTGVAHLRDDLPALEPSAASFLVAWLEALEPEERTLLYTVDLLCEPAISSQVRRDVFLAACAAQGIGEASYAEQQLVSRAHVVTKRADLAYHGGYRLEGPRAPWMEGGGPPFAVYRTPALRHPVYRVALEQGLRSREVRASALAVVRALLAHPSVRGIPLREVELSPNQWDCWDRQLPLPGGEQYLRERVLENINRPFTLWGACSLLQRAPGLASDPGVEFALQALARGAGPETLRALAGLWNALAPHPSWLDEAFWGLTDAGRSPVSVAELKAGLEHGFDSPFLASAYPRIARGYAQAGSLDARLDLAVLLRDQPNRWPELTETFELLRADEDRTLREFFATGHTTYWDPDPYDHLPFC